MWECQAWVEKGAGSGQDVEIEGRARALVVVVRKITRKERNAKSGTNRFDIVAQRGTNGMLRKATGAI